MRIPKQSQSVIRIPAAVDGATGLGDVIKGVAGVFGIDPCKGCQKRANVLNHWVSFVPKQGSGSRR